MDNRRTGLRSKIWALDPKLTLEGLKQLFRLNYTEPIKYLGSVPSSGVKLISTL